MLSCFRSAFLLQYGTLTNNNTLLMSCYIGITLAVVYIVVYLVHSKKKVKFADHIKLIKCRAKKQIKSPRVNRGSIAVSGLTTVFRDRDDFSLTLSFQIILGLTFSSFGV